MKKNWVKLGIFTSMLTFVLLLIFLGSSLLSADSSDWDIQSSKQGQMEIQVPPPPLSEDFFPCSECHGDMETNMERRELEFHDEIELKHDATNRWCIDCHDASNRDMLHSASGELIDFKESYKLCGQCHGPKLRDWKAGIHGRRTGQWNGQKQYLLCAHCHDPHSPKFKKMKPEPAPKRPGKIK
ncbi:hypothetical protein ACFLT9_00620 [Acidobacteriota bacterium]